MNCEMARDYKIPAISLHVFFSGIYLKKNFFFFLLLNIFCPLRFGSADAKTADTKAADVRTADTKGRLHFSKTVHSRSVLLT